MDKTDACVGITYVYMTAKEIHKDMALKFGGDPCFYATMNKGVVEFKWGTDSTDVDTWSGCQKLSEQVAVIHRMALNDRHLTV